MKESNVPTDAQREAALRQAQRENKIATFERSMAYKIEQGHAHSAELVDAITRQGVLHAIEWEAEPAILQSTMGDLWREVQVRYETGDTQGDPVASIRPVVKQVEKELLKNFIVKSSTSNMTNAAYTKVAEGKSRFYEDATGMIGFLEHNVTPDS